MIDDQERQDNIDAYDAWIVRARRDGKCGDEAWGRWVAAKYTQTGKYPGDPLLAAKQEAVSKEHRKAYMRELMRKKRAESADE